MAADNDPTHSVVVEEAEHDPAGEAAAEALARLRFVPADVYEVQGEIARGGMGVIFEAWDTKHERAVAIKTLQAQDPLWVRRFLREVQITAQLQHPSIIPLYEAGRWPTGEPYYAMRLVEGQSLARAAEQAGTTHERLALLPHLIALSDALAYAHEKGIIHRDLKPTNVLVGRFGETVVIDWGLAKRVGEGDVAPAGGAPSVGADLTMAGEVLGTLAFMAPEQARGDAVDARSDVYALGALAYHVLSGTRPYSTATSVDQVIAGPPRAIDEVAPDLPADLRAIVGKAMAREPEDRYPSAKGLATDLKAYATGRLVSAKSYSSWTLLLRWVARNRVPVGLGIAFIVTLAVTLAVAVTRVVRERDRADASRGVALRSQEAAEQLVDYLLRELRGKLEGIGRLDVLSGLSAEVEKYYTSVPAAEAPALVRRADALGLLGSVERDGGKAEAALTRLARAQGFYEQALAHALRR
jgi:hypothetical protein